MSVPGCPQCQQADPRNLILHCGGPLPANLGLLWVAAADTPPAEPTSATSVLPAHYLDAGLIEFPADADFTTPPARFDLLELTRTAVDLVEHGGRWHLFVDLFDGATRIRWHLPVATVTAGPAEMRPSWRCTLDIAVDPATCARAAERAQLI